MDTPSRPALTTVGQLIYGAPPGIDLARLVADLDSALAGSAAEDRRLSWDHDDVALLDVGSSRIALALDAEGGPAVVTVAVGFGPEPGRDAGLAQRQDVLARLIADRIAARFPPREARWSACDEVATPDLIDRLREGLAPLDRVEAPPRRPPRRAGRLDEAAEVPRLLARVEATLAARRDGRPDPVPANDRPDLPPADASGLRAVRAALYAGPEDLAETPSPIMRLAAHTLDASLMIVALPVGAAMMTYSIGRGANLRTSARMVAVCGIAMGALHSVGGVAGLGTIIQLSI